MWVCTMLPSGARWCIPPPELTAAAVISIRIQVAFPAASPGATMTGGGKTALTFTDVNICTRVGLYLLKPWLI